MWRVARAQSKPCKQASARLRAAASPRTHEEDWELQWIQAQGGVVVQNDGFKTTSDLAVYDLAAGTVLFRGKPHWEMDDYDCRGVPFMTILSTPLRRRNSWAQ